MYREREENGTEMSGCMQHKGEKTGEKYRKTMRRRKEEENEKIA